MQAGANVNIIAGGATPLHIAADIGNIQIINCLLKAGADPNVADEVRLSLYSFSHNTVSPFTLCLFVCICHCVFIYKFWSPTHFNLGASTVLYRRCCEQ